MQNLEASSSPNSILQMNQSPSCPLCDSRKISSIQRMENMPVFSNVLWRDRQAAISAPRGTIDLVSCEDCGHVFNRAFDPTLLAYGVDYENSLHFSPRFQDYAIWLANRLIERHNLHGKKILEVGSGKGDFLRLICELGENQGYGFDPSYAPTEEDKSDERVQFFQDPFDERYAQIHPDLICSRHTLEHLPDPAGFLSMLRRTIGTGWQPSLYIEVPNVDLIVKDLSIWDLIYEHFSYFSSASLGNLMERTGYIVEEVKPTYEGQFLSLDALPSPDPSNNPVTDTSIERSDRAFYLEHFAEAYSNKLGSWRQRLNDSKKNHRRTVLWGAGSKGITFLNWLGDAGEIEYVVDINPRKLGMFVSGAGQEIISPERLRDYRPDAVVIMNPIYQDEIRKRLGELGLEPEYLYA